MHKGQAASLPVLVFAATSSSCLGCHGHRLPPLLPTLSFGSIFGGFPRGFPPALYWGVPCELRDGPGSLCNAQQHPMPSPWGNWPPRMPKASRGHHPWVTVGGGGNLVGSPKLRMALGCRGVGLGSDIPTSAALGVAQLVAPSTSPPGDPFSQQAHAGGSPGRTCER